MKAVILMFTILISTHTEAKERLRDVLDRQDEERHHARKAWDANKRECMATFPNWHDSSHADYDKNFECQKKVKAEINAFDDKHRQEICAKFNSCPR